MVIDWTIGNAARVAPDKMALRRRTGADWRKGSSFEVKADNSVSEASYTLRTSLRVSLLYAHLVGENTSGQ